MTAATSTPDPADFPPNALPALGETATPRAAADRLQYWLWIFLAAGLIWRLTRYALNFPFWGDEAMLALNLLDHGIFDINRPLENQQVAPPLFLILSQALRLTFSSAEWVLRLLPLLAGLSALVLFLRFARKYLDPIACITAFALLALSNDLVKFAVEFKPYSLDLLLGVAFLYLGWRILQNPANRAQYLILLFLSPLAFGLSYTSALLFAATALVLLPTVIFKAPWPCKALFAFAGLVATATLILIARTIAASQISAAGTFMHAFWSHAFPTRDIPDFIPWLYRTTFRGIIAYPFGNSEVCGASIAILILFALARLIRRRQFSILALLLAPFAVTFLAACLGRYPFGGDIRLQQHLAPSVFTLAGLGLSTALQLLAARFPHRAVALSPHYFFIAFMLLPLYGMARDLSVRYHRSPNDESARQLTASLRDHFPPGTPLYFPQPIRDIPPVFSWYVRVNVPGVRMAPPPSPATSPHSATPFGLLDCPVTTEGPPPPPTWQRTTLLDHEFIVRNWLRPCRIYLYHPPPAPATTRPQ